MTGFIWSAKDVVRRRRLAKLEKIQSKLVQAAKDADIDEVRELLKEIEPTSQESDNEGNRVQSGVLWFFACATIFAALVIVLLAFTWTSDG